MATQHAVLLKRVFNSQNDTVVTIFADKGPQAEIWEVQMFRSGKVFTSVSDDFQWAKDVFFFLAGPAGYDLKGRQITLTLGPAFP